MMIAHSQEAHSTDNSSFNEVNLASNNTHNCSRTMKISLDISC